MKNILKEKAMAGKPVIGTFCGIGHPVITEILSGVGFDWLLLDSEHANLGLETMQVMMQAMSGTTCTPMVRPQWNDMVTIKRILDIGAHGLLIPWLNTKEEAESAVSACTYPPEGVRGCGPLRAARFDPDYLQTANDELFIIAQVETPQAIDNLDDILSVKGIDACYIGPQDLAMNLGLGRPDWDNPKYLECFDRVLEIAKKHGKPAGMFTSVKNLVWALEKGFTLNTVEGDDHFITDGAKAALELFHSNTG